MRSSFLVHSPPLQAIHQNHKPKKEERLVLWMCLAQHGWVKHLRAGKSESMSRFILTHQYVKLCVSECGRETFDYKSLIVKQARPKKINAIHAQVTTVPPPHSQPCKLINWNPSANPWRSLYPLCITTISTQVLHVRTLIQLQLIPFGVVHYQYRQDWWNAGLPLPL